MTTVQGCGIVKAMEKLSLAVDATESVIFASTRYCFRPPFTEKRVLQFVQSFKRMEGSGCWIWQQSIDDRGYGKTSWKGSTGPAHRLSYRIFKGDVEIGKEIHHECKNRACINPEHLTCLTPGEHKAVESALRHVEFCTNGHEMIASNVYRYPGTDKLSCRECKRIWAKEHRALKPEKLQCRRGHPYTEESTRWYQGRRYCKPCHAENTLKYYREKKAVVPLDIPAPSCYTVNSEVH